MTADRAVNIERQRVEAIAALLPGMAHDLNNVLSVILNYAEFARKRSDDPRVRDYLDAIRAGAVRTGTSVRLMLEMSDKGGRNGGPWLTGEDVRRAAGEGPQVVVDGRIRAPLAGTGLEMLVENLCACARASSTGTSPVRVQVAAVGLPEEATPWELPDGPYIRVAVSWEGAMVSDPRFERAQLLAWALRGGLRSRTEGGDTLIEAIVPGVPEPSEPPEREPPRGSGERVIVIEAPGLAEFVVEILREYGYDAVNAWTPARLSKMLRETDARCDAVIADDLFADPLFEEVRRLRPSAGLLVTSGRHSLEDLRARSYGQNVAAVSKPFLVADLLFPLRNVLDQAREP